MGSAHLLRWLSTIYSLCVLLAFAARFCGFGGGLVLDFFADFRTGTDREVSINGAKSRVEMKYDQLRNFCFLLHLTFYDGGYYLICATTNIQSKDALSFQNTEQTGEYLTTRESTA